MCVVVVWEVGVLALALGPTFSPQEMMDLNLIICKACLVDWWMTKQNVLIRQKSVAWEMNFTDKPKFYLWMKFSNSLKRA